MWRIKEIQKEGGAIDLLIINLQTSRSLTIVRFTIAGPLVAQLRHYRT